MGDVSQARNCGDAACAHGRREHESFSGLSRPTSYRTRAHQGRHPLRAFAFNGGNRGAGDVDELEMRAGSAAIRWREGRGSRWPYNSMTHATRGRIAPFYEGDHSV